MRIKKTALVLIMSSIILIQTSCASLNKAHGEFHYQINVTKGQELIDLKKALDDGAITQKEFELMKEKVINDDYVKSIIEKFEEVADDDEKES